MGRAGMVVVQIKRQCVPERIVAVDGFLKQARS